METLIISNKYKVTHIVHAQPDFCVLSAVNIEERQQDEVLLDVYEGEYLKSCLKWFDALKNCPEFSECFVSGSSFVAVFADKRSDSPDIDAVFCRGAQLEWEERVKFAGELMEDTLRCADYPFEVSCALMLSSNLLILRESGKISHVFAIYPLPAANAREFQYLLTDQLRKIFLRRWGDTDSERSFLSELDAKPCTIAEMYSLWLKYRPLITGEYGMLYSKGLLQRQLYLVFRGLRRSLTTLFRKI